MPVRTYYEILGVAEAATREDIKKNYRKLVRQFHPDVHPDKAFAEKQFKQINEAYRVLYDPDQRSLYDLKLKNQRRRPPAGADSGPSASTRARASGPGPSSGRGQSRPTAAPPPPPSVHRLVRDAEYAFIRGRLGEAESLARKVVRMDRSNARAYTILGDILYARHRRDEALENYSYAIQFDPNNREVQGKLNRLLGVDGGRRAADRARQGRPMTAASAGRASAILHLVGWVTFFLILLLFLPEVKASSLPGGPIQQEGLLGGGWNTTISLALAAEGLLLGMLLRAGSFLEHHGDELMFQTLSHRGVRGRGAPLGLLLVGLAMVFFWLALGVYLVLASLQENMSKSLIRAFGVTLIFVLASALLSPEFQVGILLVGGNFVFVTLLAGWWMVDAWREGLVRSADAR